jgi:hypothetical protein
VGRLEDIAERNRHPYRKRGFAVEVPAILLLIILGLLAFTNMAAPPQPPPPEPSAKERKLHDVPLLRPRQR